MSAASDIGGGRLRRRPVCLDRHTPEGWVEIGRFPDSMTASAALDRAVAETGIPGGFRLRGSSAGRLPVRIGLTVIAAALLVLIILWIAILR